jgi:hypothetical protein
VEGRRRVLRQEMSRWYSHQSVCVCGLLAVCDTSIWNVHCVWIVMR